MRTVLMEVLKKEINIGGDRKTIAEAIALKLTKMAADGNLQAAKIIIDRVDGKLEDADKEKDFPRKGFVAEDEAEWEKYIKMFEPEDE